ncbi:hypothetical protein CVT24_011242 [Panaeolus cyanescens]|uniref:Uncharacterized protein n=1 Tax=Panaeolus cyanescens TaxID=181874 RepID=A0A409YGG0_9AGAR|nr:hypothetical protein CVT24_011242 [Panaeolus cyanescens]
MSSNHTSNLKVSTKDNNQHISYKAPSPASTSTAPSSKESGTLNQFIRDRPAFTKMPGAWENDYSPSSNLTTTDSPSLQPRGTLLPTTRENSPSGLKTPTKQPTTPVRNQSTASIGSTGSLPPFLLAQHSSPMFGSKTIPLHVLMPKRAVEESPKEADDWDLCPEIKHLVRSRLKAAPISRSSTLDEYDIIDKEHK